MILVNRAGEEIDGDQLLGMIVQKGTPSLRRLRTMYLLTLLSQR
jgi:hypothetical protein